jgi:hypothetical protein
MYKTQRFIERTGGRGRWTSALNEFAAEVKNRSDLIIVSLDWGFHEPLSFLTDGPRLFEATWDLNDGIRFNIATNANVFYLVHPAEYAQFPFGQDFVRTAGGTGSMKLSLQPRNDRHGRTVFFVVRFVGE